MEGRTGEDARVDEDTIMKRLAIVASGWHYPHNFYETMSKQHIPKGWTVDYFCVSHRDPSHAEMPCLIDLDENEYTQAKNTRLELDRKLYPKIITKEEIEKLGWEYKEYPNTIGDWGNSNQWLEDHDYTKYDLFLFTHDDNLILRFDMLKVVCEEMYHEDWLILTNTVGVPAGSLRGSFEFFKREMMDIMGGKFDLSQTLLDRTGETDNPANWTDLYDWNTTVYPLTNLLTEKKLWERVITFSPIYRVSLFCIEGERGLISNSQPNNKPLEDEGIKWLESQGII